MTDDERQADATDRLIDFWRRLDGGDTDWIHPEDREVLQSKRFRHKVLWNTPPNQSEVVEEHLREPSRLHSGLIPQPYIGDLRQADIVLCLLNPGTDPSNYLSERDGTLSRRRKLAGLRQEVEDGVPFWAVDPDIADTGAFSWWWPRFTKLGKALVKDGWIFNEAMAELATRIACVEIVAYHSRKGDPVTPSLIKALPSSRLAIDYVKHKAATGAQVILFRSHSDWGLEDDRDRIRLVTDASRSIVVGPATQAGRIIRMRMNPDLTALTPFADLFSHSSFDFGHWEGGATKDGVMQMPWFSLSDEGNRFLQSVYSGGWILPRFSWTAWIDTEEASDLRDRPGVIEAAPIRTLAKLLTSIVRSDRFCEGAMAQAVDSGLMLRILRRIEELEA